MKNMDTYDSLIDDTIAYIKELMPPKKGKINVTLPPAPPKPQTIAKPQAVTQPLPISPPPKPVKEIKLKEEKKEAFFFLEPPAAPLLESNEGVRKILKEIAPDLYQHESIPSDFKAKRIKEAWREKRETPAIPILYQGTEYRSFITRIAKAIDIAFGSCNVVDVVPEKKWDLFLESENLKLIIAPDTLIFGTKELLSFYQENPQQKKRKLGNIPLLLLPDLSLYFKDPYLKRALWNVICNTINSLE